MTCEECGDTGHSGSNCLELQEDMNYLNNNKYYYYRPQQNQGWNQQQRLNYLGNYLGNYQGNNSFNQPPLRELVFNQENLMDSMSKKLASNDKTLETINNRMDSFSTTIKNQLIFNKMLESQLQQLANIVPTN
jgi:ribosomal protein S4